MDKYILKCFEVNIHTMTMLSNCAVYICAKWSSTCTGPVPQCYMGTCLCCPMSQTKYNVEPMSYSDVGTTSLKDVERHALAFNSRA